MGEAIERTLRAFSPEMNFDFLEAEPESFFLNPPKCSIIFYPVVLFLYLGSFDRPEEEVSLYNFRRVIEKPDERWLSKDSYEHLLKEFSKPHTKQYLLGC